MCRLLAVKHADPFDPADHLRALAHIARNSREYQGHGWGCAWVDEQDAAPESETRARASGAPRWRLYHNIKPIWQDDLTQFPRTRLLIAHARSAFRDEGIAVENNMPFSDGRHVFAFNGELHGVRIRQAGRIGAERIFNYVRWLAGAGGAASPGDAAAPSSVAPSDAAASKPAAPGESAASAPRPPVDLAVALRRAVEIIPKRTRYVRAMNIILSDGRRVLVSSQFNADPDYFTMHVRSDGRGVIVCSEPYPGGAGWRPIASGSVLTLE